MIPVDKVREIVSKHKLLERELSSDKIDKKKFAKISKEYSDLNEILFVESNPIPVKWMLHRIGRITDGIRLPLSSFNVEFHDRAETILKNLHLLN